MNENGKQQSGHRRLAWTAVLCAVLALPLASCTSVDEEQVVAVARDYMQQHKLKEASLELRNVLQQNPKNAEARYLLGLLNLRLGDMASAAKEFRKAREAGWSEAESRLGLARALTGGRELDRIAALQVKDTYPPEVQANLYGLKAYALATAGEIDAARQMLAKAADIDKHAVDYLRTAIQLAIVQKEHARAEALLADALQRYPGNNEILLLSGYHAMSRQDNDKAVAQFEKVLAHEPRGLVTLHGRNARLALARLALLRKDTAAAEKLLAPILRQAKDDIEANYMAAVADFDAGNFEQAEIHLLKVLKYVPDNEKTLRLFGSVNFAQKDYEQAAYYLNKYIQLQPEDVTARKLLARVFMLQGQPEEAEKILQSAGQTSEDDVELLALIGMSQLRSGDLEAGIAGLEKALQASPSNRALRSQLARAYITAGDTEKAIRQLNRIQDEGGQKDQAEVLKIAAYLRAGQHDNAITLVLDMLKRRPDDAVVMALAGNVFAASGDKQEARRYYNKAIALDADYALGKMLLAALDEEEGRLEQAERLYREVRDSMPQSIEPYLALARLARDRGDEKAMLKWMEMAREQIARDQLSRLLLAEYHLQNRQLDRVEELVKELNDIAAGDAAVLAMQARLLMAQKRYNEALAPLNKLLTGNSDYLPGRLLLGEVYMRLGQRADARRQLNLALKQDRYNLSALSLLANLELAENRLDAAEEHIARIKQLKPESDTGFLLEGEVAERRGQYARAEAAFEHAMQLQPASSTAVRLAGARLSRNDHEGAAAVLQQWLQAHPQDITARQYLGSVYQTAGKADAAIGEYRRVLEKSPDNVVVLNNLAWLYSQQGNAEALALAERAHHLLPDNPGIQDTYGWILLQQGQVEKARRMLQQALAAMPDSPEVQYHHAAALARSGEKAEASKRLRRLLQRAGDFSGRDEAEKLLQQL